MVKKYEHGMPASSSDAWKEHIELEKQATPYWPTDWAYKHPVRLYHTTSEEGLRKILEGGEMKSFSEGAEVFFSAKPTEHLGYYTILVDGRNLIEKGFSARTFHVDENEEVVTVGEAGTIPKGLWETFKYPPLPRRDYLKDGDISELPFGATAYTTETWEKFAEERKWGGQESFIRPTPFSLDSNDVLGIIYEDIFDNREVADDVAASSDMVNRTMSFREAMYMYPELGSDKRGWEVNSRNVGRDVFPVLDRPTIADWLRDR